MYLKINLLVPISVCIYLVFNAEIQFVMFSDEAVIFCLSLSYPEMQPRFTRAVIWVQCNSFQSNEQAHSHSSAKLYLVYWLAHINFSQTVPRVWFDMWNHSQSIVWLILHMPIDALSIFWLRFMYAKPYHRWHNYLVWFGCTGSVSRLAVTPVANCDQCVAFKKGKSISLEMWGLKKTRTRNLLELIQFSFSRRDFIVKIGGYSHFRASLHVSRCYNV